MNKIKRKTVEELFNAYKDWQDEFKRECVPTECSTKKWNVYIEKRKEFEKGMDTEKSNDCDYAKYCLVSDFVSAIVFAKMSLSRLLKCLEVCGIEIED